MGGSGGGELEAVLEGPADGELDVVNPVGFDEMAVAGPAG
jgi:hypothetical protein